MIRHIALSLGFIACASLALAQPTAPSPDELVALNFYVQQKDSASTSAELRRLQLKYPTWQPPQDLSQLAITSPSGEIDQIYRQIASGQFAQARQTIEATQKTFPQWVPPADMMALLDVTEGQKSLDAALDAKDLPQALQLVGQTPGLMRCNRINNAWRIAGLQEAAGQKADAYNTYRAVARACVSTADITATLEKANSVTTDDELLGLFADVNARLPEMKATLDPLEQRLLAGRGLTPPAGVAVTDLRAGVNAPRPVEETPVAPPKAEKAPAVKAAPPKVAVQKAPVQRTVQAPSSVPRAGDTSGCGAPASLSLRGWCQFNLNQPAEAISTFRRALQSKMSGAEVRDARYGMALAYLKLRLPEEAAKLAVSTDLTHIQRVDIERQILDQRGVAAYKRGDYRRSIEYFNAIEDIAGTLRRDLAVMRAYAYLNTGNRTEANRQFTKLDNVLSSKDTRSGLAASATQ